jgi:hypothetical protein
MSERVNLLMIEFLDWIASRPRTYAESMEAWRTTCPRHSVWEDAIADGLIRVEGGSLVDQPTVKLTPKGKAILSFEAKIDFDEGVQCGLEGGKATACQWLHIAQAISSPIHDYHTIITTLR